MANAAAFNWRFLSFQENTGSISLLFFAQVDQTNRLALRPGKCLWLHDLGFAKIAGRWPLKVRLTPSSFTGRAS